MCGHVIQTGCCDICRDLFPLVATLQCSYAHVEVPFHQQRIPVRELTNGSDNVLNDIHVIKGKVESNNKPPLSYGRHLETQQIWPMLLHRLNLDVGCVVLVEYCHPSDVPAWGIGYKNVVAL